MNKLTVLYDAHCEFCRHCRRWLDRQPKFLDLVFIPAGSNAAQRRFPDLQNVKHVEELTVISDTGGVYRNAHAWIMCLYALREYREWSATLAHPAMLPLAKGAFHLLSRNRSWISRWLGPSDEAMVQAVQAAGDESNDGPIVEDGIVIIED